MNTHPPTARNPVHRTARLLLAIVIAPTLAVLLNCTAAPPSPTPDIHSQEHHHTDAEPTIQAPATAGIQNNAPTKGAGLNDKTTGQTPEWIQFFTKDPKVLAYRWYKGENCPSGDYSHRDDLYIFDSEEALSPIEIQERDLEGKIIGSKGFHSTAGHICLALSEEITPASYTALHELAHAIAYSEHGLTGHNTIHTETLVTLVLEFEKADCKTKDGDLLTLIQWNRIQLVWGDNSDTPPNGALTSYCNPSSMSKITPTALPPAPTSTKETTAPPPRPEDRTVHLHYDASNTPNDLTEPVIDRCHGRSGPVTKWSRTLDVQGESATFADRDGHQILISNLTFAKIRPRRPGGINDIECPADRFHVTASLTNLTSEESPNLSGYHFLWLNANGDVITRQAAEEGITFSLSHLELPRDLYDRPASLLIFDNRTKDAQPTPTPKPVVDPQLKVLEIEIDISTWEQGETRRRGERYLGTQYAEWTETDRTSGELERGAHTIYDANAREWHVTHIEVTEKQSSIETYSSTLYSLRLENYNRALADFSDYKMEIVKDDSTVIGSGSWVEPNNQSQAWLGITQFEGYNNERETKAVTLRLWDTSEATLAPTKNRKDEQKELK